MRSIADIFRKAERLFAVKKPAYNVQGDSIIYSVGEGSQEKIRLADIAEWIDHNDPWICWVTLRLKDGSEKIWQDVDCQLETLLYSVAPERVRVESPIQPPQTTTGSGAPDRV